MVTTKRKTKLPGARTYKLTPEQRDAIVRMYQDGFKCEYIAALFGVRREYPSKLALRRGAAHRMPTMRRNVDATTNRVP
jgi:hypothetical protein